MKYLYSVALLSAAAVARCPEQAKKDYFGFAARFDISVKDTKDLEDRMANFERNNKIIKEMNLKAKGATFGPNPTMDMSDEDYKRQLGIRIPDHAKELKDNKGHSDHGH